MSDPKPEEERRISIELKPGLEVRAQYDIGNAVKGDLGLVLKNDEDELVVWFHRIRKAMPASKILHSIMPLERAPYRFCVSVDLEAGGPVEAYSAMRRALDACGFGWETDTAWSGDRPMSDEETQSVIEEAISLCDAEEIEESSAAPLKPCTACGALVPEHDAPPYDAHDPTCRLVADWRSPSRRLRMATALEYLADAVGSNLPLEKKIEQARLALEAGGFLGDREEEQRRELQVNRLDVLRAEREAAHVPHRFKVAGLVVDLREVVAINQQENPTCTFVYLKTGQAIWLPIPSAEIVAAWEKVQ